MSFSVSPQETNKQALLCSEAMAEIDKCKKFTPNLPEIYSIPLRETGKWVNLETNEDLDSLPESVYCLDVETIKDTKTLVLASAYDMLNQIWYIWLSTPEENQKLHISGRSIIVAHRSTFELGFIWECFHLDCKIRFFCTHTMACNKYHPAKVSLYRSMPWLPMFKESNDLSLAGLSHHLTGVEMDKEAVNVFIDAKNEEWRKPKFVITKIYEKKIEAWNKQQLRIWNPERKLNKTAKLQMDELRKTQDGAIIVDEAYLRLHCPTGKLGESTEFLFYDVLKADKIEKIKKEILWQDTSDLSQLFKYNLTDVQRTVAVFFNMWEWYKELPIEYISGLYERSVPLLTLANDWFEKINDIEEEYKKRIEYMVEIVTKTEQEYLDLVGEQEFDKLDWKLRVRCKDASKVGKPKWLGETGLSSKKLMRISRLLWEGKPMFIKPIPRTNSNNEVVIKKDGAESQFLQWYVCKEEYIKNSWLETVLDCWQDPLKYEILDNPTNTSGEPKDIVTVFSKTFMQYWGKQLTSESVFANKIAETYASISFWGSFRDRAINKTPIATVQSMGQHYYGLCLRPLVAGTITNRAVDPIGLVIPSASKNKVGSEIGGHFTSPKGWKYVYADLDSIQAIITALYCAIGTEKVIAEKNNSRIPAKINVLNNEFSISVITGTKKDKTALAWLIANRADWLDVSMSKMEASEEWKIAKGTNNTKLMAELIEKAEDTPYKKGKTAQYAMLFGAARMKLGILLSDLALAEVIILYFKGTRNKTTWKWEGGIASEYFNYIEFLSKGGCKIGTKFITLNSISSSFLGREMSNILHPRLRKKEFGGTATNATVQSIDVDCLCFLADGIKKASRDENIIARYSTSVHDEICFLVQDENADRVAKIFDEVHEKMYIRLFDALGLDLGSAPKKMFTFDSVDISTRKTKKPKDKGITLSNMDGYDYEISASIDDDEFYESAEYWDDGSVPEMTSFETTKKVIQKAKTQVKQCCKDYNTVIQDPTQH